MNNDIYSHWARIPGCTATCVWCASVLFDVPSATSRKTCTDVTMACARPVRDPEMLALDHISPLGLARGPFQRSRGAAGVPRGVLPSSGELGNTPLAPQKRPMQPAADTAAWLTCPAQPDWSRAAGLPPLARERERFVDGRFHGGAPASAVKEFDSLRYAWYWADHPPSSRIEIPHEPPKRCGLTHQNPLCWALKLQSGL